eukprot:CAMPEP_0119057090 /NCGR_PEP_ID=MMETSP1178-20130426/1618_1 /TAXON_ID=33656 /ORGANISM="unid sp, Strain CCMP2000" /LENGTH=51 /DNA_ID=CAMNT_0007037887 /DNA_START=8 /DNA_END=160 /DNA_ORIENTATION=-
MSIGLTICQLSGMQAWSWLSSSHGSSTQAPSWAARAVLAAASSARPLALSS